MLLENNAYPQDTRVRNEARSLTAAGYRVRVLAPRRRGQTARETVDSVSVRRFRLPPERDGAGGLLLEYVVAHLQLFTRALLELLRGADVVHLHNPPDSLCAVGALARLMGRRVVFDHHDLAPELFAAKFGAARAPIRIMIWFERAAMRIAHVVLAANESHRDIAVTRARKAGDAVVIVRNAPSVEHFHAARSARSGHTACVDIVFLGELGQQDGVVLLADIMAELDRRAVTARLTVVGDGPARVELEQRLAWLGLTDRVHFTGAVAPEEVPALLAAADICIDPAPSTPLNERSTMIKIAEYLAAGRPVVAQPLTETRRTAGSAALYGVGATELAEAVTRLARSGALRDEMCARARARAPQLSWAHSERALLSAYSGLLVSYRVARTRRKRAEGIRGARVVAFAAVMLTGWLLSSAPAFGEEVVALDTYDASDDGVVGPVFTRAALEGDRFYVAVVSGTYSLWSARAWETSRFPKCGAPELATQFPSPGRPVTPSGLDAEFVFGRVTSEPTCPPMPQPRPRSFWMSTGSGFAKHVPVGAPAAPSADHIYSYVLRGEGAPAAFILRDNVSHDNSGQLLIFIRAATAADCTAFGAAAFAADGSFCTAIAGSSASVQVDPTCRDRVAPASTRPIARLVLKRGFVKLSGQTVDRGCGLSGVGSLHQVRISIGRMIGTRCRFLRSNLTFSSVRSCRGTTYVTARSKATGAGKVTWSYFLPRSRLPAGKYRLWVRGIDGYGNVELKSRARNFARFTIPRRQR